VNLMSDNPSKTAAIEEMRFRLLIDAVVDYAIYMIDPDGIITSWNTGAKRFKGYEKQEIIGEHFSRFYTEQDRAAACRNGRWTPQSAKDDSKAKAGAFARTVRISGAMW
jgi:PAS domain-containing protein